MSKILLILISLFTLSSYIQSDYLGVPEERIFSIDKEDSTEFTVKTNEEFIMKVSGNPTTGYSWYLTSNSDESNLKCLNLNKWKSSENYVVHQHEPGFVGVGGTYYFKFQGIKEGLYVVTLVKKRIWEQEDIQTKNIKVEIKN